MNTVYRVTQGRLLDFNHKLKDNFIVFPVATVLVCSYLKQTPSISPSCLRKQFQWVNVKPNAQYTRNLTFLDLIGVNGLVLTW